MPGAKSEAESPKVSPLHRQRACGSDVSLVYYSPASRSLTSVLPFFAAPRY